MITHLPGKDVAWHDTSLKLWETFITLILYFFTCYLSDSSSFNSSVSSPNRLFLSFQWLELLESGLTEAKWTKRKSPPTVREYMTNGAVSFALGPLVVLTCSLVGPLLSDEAVQSSQFRKLFLLTGLCGRLLNDVQSFKVKLDTLILCIYAFITVFTKCTVKLICAAFTSIRLDETTLCRIH